MKNLVGYQVDIVFNKKDVVGCGIVMELLPLKKKYKVNFDGVVIDLKRKEFKLDMFKNEMFLPKHVLEILEKYDFTDLSQKKGWKLKKQLKKVGYKFDWDADGSPMYLRKRKKKKEIVPRETEIVKEIYC